MLRVTLKNLFARKFRLVLTSLAVVLGVAFMAGTFVLTDTIGKVFDELFADVNRGVDVAVRSRPAFDEKAGGPGSRGGPRAGPRVAARAPSRGVDGVAAAEGGVAGYALVAKIGKDGQPEDAVQPSGAPTIGVAWGPNRRLNQAFGGDGRPEVGHRPRAPGQVAHRRVDRRRGRDLRAGRAARAWSADRCADARAQVVFLQHPPEAFDVVAIFQFGTVGNLAGATLAAFDTPTAQEVMNRVGEFDEIRIAAEPGVSQTALERRVRDAVRAAPRRPQLRGADRERSSRRTRPTTSSENLSFFNTFLLVFAFIALFVGAFIIYNTFSIIVAQRAARARVAAGARRVGEAGHDVGRARGARRRRCCPRSSVSGSASSSPSVSRVRCRAFGFDLPSARSGDRHRARSSCRSSSAP